MKQIILTLFLMLAISSCQYNEEAESGIDVRAIPMSFYAGIELPSDDSATKTILGGTSSDSYRSVLWEYGDEAYVTNGTSYAKFTNQTEGTSDLAVLEGTLAQGTNYYAAYPYDMVTGYSSAGFSIELPATQEYYKDGISSNSFPMVAQCQDGVFSFKNLCGIFVLRLTGEKSVSSITFSGNDSEGNALPVAGIGTISMSYSDYPSMSLNSSLTYQVTLSCGEGVSLDSTTPTSFHIVLPVSSYYGFDINIQTSDGTNMVISSDKILNIKRSTRTTTAQVTYDENYDLIDYIDEYGVNHGKGTKIDGVVWAPVNCGYKAPSDDSKGFPYGKLYQWGRQYGQGYSSTYDASTPTVKSGPVALATGQSSSNANVFYTCTPAPYNWCTTREDYLWSSGGYSPCPSGWRVPTADELGTLDDNKSEWTTHEDKTGYWFSGSVPYSDSTPSVFLPAAGLRYYKVDSYNGGPYSRGSAGVYWSSKSYYYYSGASSYWTGAFVLRFNETDSSLESSNRYRAYGYSVRCVQILD